MVWYGVVCGIWYVVYGVIGVCGMVVWYVVWYGDVV